MTNKLILMPESLTAENGAKYALLGEFHETTPIQCHECHGYTGDMEECEICDGTGELTQRVPVEWTTIKEIYKRAVELLGQSQDDAIDQAVAAERSEVSMRNVCKVGDIFRHVKRNTRYEDYMTIRRIKTRIGEYLMRKEIDRLYDMIESLENDCRALNKAAVNNHLSIPGILGPQIRSWMIATSSVKADDIAAGVITSSKITAEQIPCGSLAADPLPRDPEEAQEVKPIITGTPSELCKTFDLVSMEFLGDVGEDLGQILAGGTVIKFNQTDSEGPLKPCLIRHVPIGTAMVVTKQIRDGKKQRSTFIKSGSTSGIGWIAFSETRLDWDNSSAYTHSAGHQSRHEETEA